MDTNVTLSTNYYHVMPLDTIAGFQVRPGFYQDNGATLIPCGVNFTVHSMGATSCELLLFHRMEKEPYAVLRFPDNYKIGQVYSMIIFGLEPEEFEYAYRLDGPYDPQKGLLFDPLHILLDPYAKAVTGQSQWGCKSYNKSSHRARVVKDNFDWGNTKQPMIPMKDLVIYELHVRGFTQDSSSNTKHPGTFAGLQEKIPYLKALGINAIELMPIFEFDEVGSGRMIDGKQLLDYWGYNTVSFFAPNTGYTASIEYNREGLELKTLIKELHNANIEVILDVVFNHTAEGDEHGPFISFKGFDNNIYYMLTADGKYYNFSGCGNTMNCNHPIVQQLIVECLRYWVATYRIDGFRFDLASILGRNEDASPMEQPPLLKTLAFDPILGNVKLIAEAWDASGLYQVGNFPAWQRWSEWNGKYRDDLRQFLKGDYWLAPAAVQRITGSPDLYDVTIRGNNASVNFLTCHDGFTLHDLYSYNQKHNVANGWDNADGTNDNYSWNCGCEGETKDSSILSLRWKMIKNACTVLMCSRGTPMFLAGDEFGNTTYGNNNPYCQDNEISWLDWNLIQTNKEFFNFFTFMIHFRHTHPCIKENLAPSSLGFPCISFHGRSPDETSYDTSTKVIGILFAGFDHQTQSDDIVYLTVNSYWETCEIILPDLPATHTWRLIINTGNAKSIVGEQDPNAMLVHRKLQLEPRSVGVLVAEQLYH